jgi:hypothetical protein
MFRVIGARSLVLAVRLVAAAEVDLLLAVAVEGRVEVTGGHAQPVPV